MPEYYNICTAKAPVNIAVIKYWGKKNEQLKIPINDSISGTLNIDDMCATTSIAISNTFETDELWLNGTKQDLGVKSSARILLEELRKLSKLDASILKYKAHIVSHNNFPTAAGLASSAAGYACLAFVVGHAYGITSSEELSKIARQGSGSACRSLFGGFVKWEGGEDHDTSKAVQLADHTHWPRMRVVICVANDKQKDVSSSEGMLRSVNTSTLIKYRADVLVPSRIQLIEESIKMRNFELFAEVTMQDSNQFHAICLDSFPPIFYLNEASRHIIKICHIINSIYDESKVAYTFDAGPNACVYLLDDFLDTFLGVIQYFFSTDNSTLEVKGKAYSPTNLEEIQTICSKLEDQGVGKLPDSLRYLISTTIGDGPKLIDKHIDDAILKA